LGAGDSRSTEHTEHCIDQHRGCDDHIIGRQQQITILPGVKGVHAAHEGGEDEEGAQRPISVAVREFQQRF
jgi:hypothetical protein